MTEIVSLEKKNEHYVVVLRYTPNWLMRLFGKKEWEKTYVSIGRGCCYDIEMGYGFDFTDIDGRYRDWETDRKSTRLNSSHRSLSRMPSSA